MDLFGRNRTERNPEVASLHKWSFASFSADFQSNLEFKGLSNCWQRFVKPYRDAPAERLYDSTNDGGSKHDQTQSCAEGHCLSAG